MNLETLSDELEKITASADNASDKDIKMAEILEIATKANLDKDGNILPGHDFEQEHDEEMNQKLDGIKHDIEHFIKFVK